MGMFDTIYNQYEALGEDFLGELQTKDLECCMGSFWLSPSGNLYEIDYSGTQDFEPCDEKKEKGILSFPYKIVKNGNKGRIRPYLKCSFVRAYHASINKEFKEVFFFLKMGVVTEIFKDYKWD